MKALLVSMPFTAVDRPALGLSLLKARLQEAGAACDVSYFSLAFAALIGLEPYEALVHDVPYTSLACEWVFSSCLFDFSQDDDEAYVDDILVGQWMLPDDQIETVLHARAHAARFIDAACAGTAWGDYDVVGFSTVGQQNVASLALARAVKARFPGPVILFGGHAWEGPMGREQLRRFPFVDCAISGEADSSLPAFVAALGTRAARATVPGLIYRDGARTKTVPELVSEESLPADPLPDHDDYFRARGELPGIDAGQLVIPLEASRGCWWARRRPCAFCGLSGRKRTYRTKSPDAVVKEMLTSAGRWPGARLDMVDNVVPDTFLDEVLPRLAAGSELTGLSFAVRPGVRKDHLRHAAAVGTSLQCGVESLSDEVLKLMGKGTRGLENIRFLRWCRELDIQLDWNMLYAVPGEVGDHYRQVMQVLPAIRFLSPPESCSPVTIERFSAYFRRPDDYGLRNVRPARAYCYVYPFARAALTRLAYFFDFNQPCEADRPGYVQHLKIEVKAWQRDPDPGVLTASDDGEDLLLTDTRAGRGARRARLSADERRLYLACDDIAGVRALCDVAGTDPDDPAQSAAVRSRLQAFVDRGWMVTDGERYLSLAIASAETSGERSGRDGSEPATLAGGELGEPVG